MERLTSLLTGVHATDASRPEARELARNTSLNLAGQVLPLVFALVAVPPTLAALGVERFGVLAMSWAVLGSFNVFDLALGRAVTKYAAEARQRGEDGVLPRVVWNAAALQTAIGILGTLALFATTPWLVDGVLDVPAGLDAETKRTFYLLALSFPITLLTGCLRGLLEALGRFDMINAVRVIGGSSTFAIPWLGSSLGLDLAGIVALLVAFRALLLGAHWMLAVRLVPELGRRPGPFSVRDLRSLARFGGWATTGNLISPVLDLYTRFLVGSLVSMTAVAHLSVPYEMVFRLWVLPTSVLSTVFPAFASAHARRERSALLALIRSAVRANVVLLSVPIAAGIVFAPELLRLWLRNALGDGGTSALALRILAAGMPLAAMGGIFTAVLQAAGRPDLAGRLKLYSVPVWIAAQWLLVRRWGVPGAALGLALRWGVDALLLAFSTVSVLHALKTPKCGTDAGSL